MSSDEAHTQALSETIDNASAQEFFPAVRSYLSKDRLNATQLSKLDDAINKAGMNRENIRRDIPTAESFQRLLLDIPEFAAIEWPRIEEIRATVSDLLALVQQSSLSDRLPSFAKSTPQPACFPTVSPKTP